MTPEDQVFTQRIQEKIERLTDAAIDLEIDFEEEYQLKVDLDRIPPQVTLGRGIFQYPGFARMGVEYAVACLKRRRSVELIEFHMLLSRN